MSVNTRIAVVNDGDGMTDVAVCVPGASVSIRGVGDILVDGAIFSLQRGGMRSSWAIRFNSANDVSAGAVDSGVVVLDLVFEVGSRDRRSGRSSHALRLVGCAGGRVSLSNVRGIRGGDSQGVCISNFEVVHR